jgi:hypothetical protein
MLFFCDKAGKISKQIEATLSSLCVTQQNSLTEEFTEGNLFGVGDLTGSRSLPLRAFDSSPSSRNSVRISVALRPEGLMANCGLILPRVELTNGR